MLIFHIGLPKTASTFLQNGIFRNTEDIDFIHRKNGGKAQKICQAIRHFNSPNRLRYLHSAFRARTLLRKYRRTKDTLVIASENISVGRVSFWTGEGVGPEIVARRLADLRDSLKVAAEDCRFIIGIRRQDKWLASRYAGSSDSFDNFCQEDFEQRIRNITDSSKIEDPVSWLDYHWVRTSFLRYFSETALFFLPSERLGDDADDALRELGSFMGGRDLLTPLEKIRSPEGQKRRNVHSISPNSWPLRNRADKITLTEEMASGILNRFSSSNREFSRYVPIDYGR